MPPSQHFDLEDGFSDFYLVPILQLIPVNLFSVEEGSTLCVKVREHPSIRGDTNAKVLILNSFVGDVYVTWRGGPQNISPFVKVEVLSLEDPFDDRQPTEKGPLLQDLTLFNHSGFGLNPIHHRFKFDLGFRGTYKHLNL